MLKRAADDEQDDRRKQGGNRNSAENTHSQCHSWQADDGYRCAMTTRSTSPFLHPGVGSAAGGDGSLGRRRPPSMTTLRV
jgi:hypothetical protein